MSKRTPKAEQLDKEMDQPHHGHEEENPPQQPDKESNCKVCHKAMSVHGCGVDGKGRSYCIPEGEDISAAQRGRLEEFGG